MREQDDCAHDATKEEIILNAAMDIFIEKGWNGARMQEIADRAGINKALLHYYFRSKENIYDRIIESVLSRFLHEMSGELDDDKPFEQVLRHFIDGLVDTIVTEPRIPMFIMHELAQGGKNVKTILTRIVDQDGFSLPHRMFTLIEREAAAGTLRPVDPPQLVITLLGSCIYYFLAEPMVEAVIDHVRPGLSYDRQRFIAKNGKNRFSTSFTTVSKNGRKVPDA